MKILVLYRPNSEHGRPTEAFLKDYQAKYPDYKIEAMNVDSRDGWATASLYDVVQYPAILVVQPNGSPAKVWQGQPLPLMDEVASYQRL